jgi:DNA polymerase
MDGRFYMVTYHPAALLRNERYKRPAWEDWKMFRAAFTEFKTNGGLPRAENLERIRRN